MPKSIKSIDIGYLNPKLSESIGLEGLIRASIDFFIASNGGIQISSAHKPSFLFCFTDRSGKPDSWPVLATPQKMNAILRDASLISIHALFQKINGSTEIKLPEIYQSSLSFNTVSGVIRLMQKPHSIDTTFSDQIKRITKMPL